jgi:hypothetical protein
MPGTEPAEVSDAERQSVAGEELARKQAAGRTMTSMSKLIADFIKPALDVEGLLAGAKQKSLNEDTYTGAECEEMAGRLLAELAAEGNPHMQMKFLAQFLADVGA